MRLKNWDYGSNGMYFITICTHNRVHFFGEIEKMHLRMTAIGGLAREYWLEIPNHFSFVELGDFVMMPNHIHGILIIDKADNKHVETLHCNVSTCSHNPTQTTKDLYMSTISPKAGTVSTIIRSYKSVVSKYARKIDIDFAWQHRFYDHVIRDAQSFERIKYYIQNNPKNWNLDKFRL